MTILDSPAAERAVRLLLAVALSSTIGLNREKADKPAGLRTHMLVALGAALFTILGFEVELPQREEGSIRRLDAFRIVQGIVGGLGFLGAGAIIKGPSSQSGIDGSVSGLTTATSVWLSGALGVACGVGAYAEAAMTTVLALLILGASRWL